MNPLKKLASDTAVYGLSSILGRLLNYLLVPLHTTVFQTDNYGIITELYVAAAFLNVVYTFGLETSYFRFASKNLNDHEKVYNSSFTLILIISACISILLIGSDTFLVNSMDYPGKENFIWIFSGILFFDAIQAIPFARLRLENKAKTFAIARIAGIATNIGVNVFFLLFCFGITENWFLSGLQPFISTIYNPAYNLEYVFFANLCGSIISSLFIYKLFFKIKLGISKLYSKSLLIFGYPILFTGLAIATNELLSRWALKYWLPENFYPEFSNQEILGIFGGVFKLAIIMNLGIQAFRYAAEPFFFSQSENKESPQLFALVLKWFVIFGCVVWLGVSINLDTLQYFLGGSDYRTAIPVVPLLLLASLFMGINYNLSAWFKLIDKTSIGTQITFVGALITIAGNYFLIPFYGYYGSAYASVLAYAGMTVISYIWGQKLNPFPYPVAKIMAYIGITGLLILLLSFLPLTGIWHFLVVNSIAIGYLVVVYIIERKSFIQLK